MKNVNMKVGKYTTLHANRSRKDRVSHSFMVRFSENPAKIFSTDYFKLVCVEHDSIYSIEPAVPGDLGSHRVCITEQAKTFRYYISFTNSAGINKIAGFKAIEVTTNLTNKKIEFMLPPSEQREAPRKSTKHIKIKNIKRKAYVKQQQPTIEIKKASSTVEDVSKQIKTLNDMISQAVDGGFKISLRIEDNFVRASVKTEIDI